MADLENTLLSLSNESNSKIWYVTDDNYELLSKYYQVVCSGTSPEIHFTVTGNSIKDKLTAIFSASLPTFHYWTYKNYILYVDGVECIFYYDSGEADQWFLKEKDTGQMHVLTSISSAWGIIKPSIIYNEPK